MKRATFSSLSVGNDRMKVSHSTFNAPINRLLEFAELLTYNKGHILFNIGNIARGMYVINKGKVKISKFGVDGKEQIIKILSHGDAIGHESLLNDERFHEYAEVLENAEIYYISREDFHTVCANYHEVLSYLTQLICSDLNRVEEKLVSSSYEPVRGRLASLLLELNGIYNKGTDTIIDLSRSDLANLAGTAKETSIRLLSEFKNEGLIDINGQHITIKDLDGLKRVSCLYK